MNNKAAELVSTAPAGIDGQQFPAIPLLEQAQILFERDGGLTECYIPAHLIDHEEVPVKEEWAESIARQMREISAEEGGTGQKTPIRVGWIEGESVFRIIDGFHRDAALIENGEKEVYATAERVTWDSLYDQRIFTAKDHAHVRFSRVVKWIQEVWEYSELHEQLSVEQAILLYRYDGDGSKLGIDADEAQEAKQWVARKERQWDIAAMTIHSYLQTAESVDPMLVNATREKTNSRTLEAPTQQIIKIFSEALPHNFELQNMVWRSAQPHNLKGPQVKALCLLVRDMDAEDARAAIAGTDVANIEPAYAETQKKQLRRASDPRHKGATALKAASTEVERVTQRVNISLERDEGVDEEMSKRLDETLNCIEELQKRLSTLAVNIRELKETSERQVAPLIDLPSQALIEKAFARHKLETGRNMSVEPIQRTRRWLAMNLPSFGFLSSEDWASLEPQYQFALTLDHPELAGGEFKSREEFWNKVLETSELVPASELPYSGKALVTIIKPFIELLTTSAPGEIGPIIDMKKQDNGSKQVTFTESGRRYLADLVKNTLISVDESKDSTP